MTTQRHRWYVGFLGSRNLTSVDSRGHSKRKEDMQQAATQENEGTSERERTAADGLIDDAKKEVCVHCHSVDQ